MPYQNNNSTRGRRRRRGQGYNGIPPQAPEIGQVTASRDIKGSIYGGGGFVDYGGGAAGALNDQLSFQAQRKAYTDEVRKAEVKELDADYGKLTASDTGVGGIDQGAENLFRDYKAQYTQAKRDFDNQLISPAEFSERKQTLFGNADSFQKASENLQTTLKDYVEAADAGTISDSTPTEVRDILSSLKNGGKGIGVEDRDGQPWLVGTTDGGAPVEKPLSDLAGGNGFRFNQTVELTKPLDDIFTNLTKRKVRTLQPDGSIAEAAPSWEESVASATEQIDRFIGNDSTLQAIAADELGLTPDDIAEATANDPDFVKDEVRAHLLSRIQKQYAPAELQSITNAAPKGTSQTAAGIKQAEVNRKRQQDGQVYNNAIQSGKLESLQGLGGITSVSKNFFGTGYVIKVGDDKYEVDPKKPETLQPLANLLGLGSLGGAQPQGGADPLGIN